uniref:HAUS augmin-like complex subunit 3 N-terminal domain-containing protein n=1 Tax=Aegilops tauschii TaxID=37682 RepID=M8AU92_AEGTA
MSAKQLCDALAAAGFDSGDPLDPESLDWAFLQGDDSSRVLAWIAARLRRANVLSASDLELYDQLELEGKLLEVKSLDGGEEGILAIPQVSAEVGAPTLHKLSRALGAEVPIIDRREGPVRSKPGLQPAVTNGLGET